MPSRVYVETSIPSFFFEERPQAEMVARRDWTRTWWAAASASSDLVTSVAVLEELERGECRVNTLLGLYNPALVTPLELLGGTGDVD